MLDLVAAWTRRRSSGLADSNITTIPRMPINHGAVDNAERGDDNEMQSITTIRTIQHPVWRCASRTWSLGEEET